MTIGTKSLLFGVHCVFLHPIFVLLGWRKCYGEFPRRLHEWLAILLHDWGYFGCTNMDGDSGICHPYRSFYALSKMEFISKNVRAETGQLVLGHSGSFSRLSKLPVSALHRPDKLAVLFEPDWFYLLRAKLSGEIYEFIRNSPLDDSTPQEWLDWYKNKVRTEFYEAKAQRQLGCPAL